MKTVVLDTNELTQDYMLRSQKYQLIEHMQHDTWMNFCVPAVVLEELVANHAREVAKTIEAGNRHNRDRRRLGLSEGTVEPLGFDYRAFVLERFDERLGFSVLPWPITPHAELVSRAVTRRRPFDSKGDGYRDALIWEDVLRLVRNGVDVALVTRDNTFAGDDKGLAPELREETEALDGTVELVQDFSSWLIAQLPWKSIHDFPTALEYSRHAEFFDWYVKSDFQSDLEPTVEDLGFNVAPDSLEIVDVLWEGDLTPTRTAVATDDGLVLVEYDLGQTVEFEAEFPGAIAVSSNWRVSEASALGHVRVEGTVDMTLRITVLFGGEFGFSVEEERWRRTDASPPGPTIYDPTIDPNQPPLFGERR